MKEIDEEKKEIKEKNQLAKGKNTLATALCRITGLPVYRKWNVI